MLIDDIALTMQPQVGAKTAIHLIEHFGSAEAIFAASADELISRAELNPHIASEIVRRNYHKQAEREVAYTIKNGIHAIAATDTQYPRFLRESTDYPHVIYFKGDKEVLSKPMLTIVGTRQMTQYGSDMCGKIIESLAQMFPELVIVSGLAFGIDSACHRAALSFGLKTIGVIANPVARVTPEKHVSLAEEMIRKGGGVMSELHSGCDPKGHGYVARNRIVAGLSEGTLVVQSPINGGSLITAQMADGYQRLVMAIPGRVGDSCSAGTNALIKNRKAQLVCSAEDIAQELGWVFSKGKSHPDTEISESAKRLLDHIKESEIISLDNIMIISGLTMQELSPLLIELEFASQIRQLPGKSYERA